MKPWDYAESREIPSFAILTWRVDRFIPSRAAAPWGPATTQFTVLERLENLLTFGFRQEIVQCAVCCGIRSSGSFFRMTDFGKFQISHIDTQGRASRDNYRALDHILEFSNVSGQ